MLGGGCGKEGECYHQLELHIALLLDESTDWPGQITGLRVLGEKKDLVVAWGVHV